MFTAILDKIKLWNFDSASNKLKKKNQFINMRQFSFWDLEISVTEKVFHLIMAHDKEIQPSQPVPKPGG